MKEKTRKENEQNRRTTRKPIDKYEKKTREKPRRTKTHIVSAQNVSLVGGATLAPPNE
jgi:hypothetical protein